MSTSTSTKKPQQAGLSFFQFRLEWLVTLVAAANVGFFVLLYTPPKRDRIQVHLRFQLRF